MICVAAFIFRGTPMEVGVGWVGPTRLTQIILQHLADRAAGQARRLHRGRGDRQ